MGAVGEAPAVREFRDPERSNRFVVGAFRTLQRADGDSDDVRASANAL